MNHFLYNTKSSILPLSNSRNSLFFLVIFSVIDDTLPCIIVCTFFKCSLFKKKIKQFGNFHGKIFRNLNKVASDKVDSGQSSL